MLTKTKTSVRIPRKEWDRLRESPMFADLIELLEDRNDLESAKQIKGDDISLENYLAKRGIQHHHKTVRSTKPR